MRNGLSLAVRAALPALLIVALAACEDEGGTVETTPTPTPSTGESTLETPTPQPTPTEEPADTPTPSPALGIAVGPEHFLYVVAEGDTLESIAGMFDAAVGDDEGYLAPEQIGELNEVSDADLEPGMLLAIPALPSSAEAIMAENSLEDALGVGEDGIALVLLQPSRELMEGYLGRVALYRATIERPNGEEPGYVMEYWFTERPGFRAGVVDPDARYVEPAFTIAAGSLAGYEDDDAVDVWDFERDGVEYRLFVYEGAEQDAETTALMFVTAAERQ